MYDSSVAPGEFYDVIEWMIHFDETRAAEIVVDRRGYELEMFSRRIVLNGSNCFVITDINMIFRLDGKL